MPVQFFGGPRDGEIWSRQCPAPGKYWFDRPVRGRRVIYTRQDLYEYRTEPRPGWYYLKTKGIKAA